MEPINKGNLGRRASYVPTFSSLGLSLANHYGLDLSNLPENKINIIKEQQNKDDEDFSMNIFNKYYEGMEDGQSSQKTFGIVRSWAQNTFRGLYKSTNEDKISAVGIVKKPPGAMHKIWPKISYFGIFDGHGGEGCSTFLRDNYLNILLENKNFPKDVKLAMTESFEKAEEMFKKSFENKDQKEWDHSGSCALVILFIDSKVWVANIGDSRAVMSINEGKKLKTLTMDHKPNNLSEFERAMKAGSKIYVDEGDDEDEMNPRDMEKFTFINDKKDFEKYGKDKDVVFREYPSDLAVMRTVGDFKVKKLSKSIISVPEIVSFDYSPYNDFIVMGCDGIFDDLSNQRVINSVWYIIKNLAKQKKYEIHELTKDACNMVIKTGLDKLTVDNLSCIVIGLEGLQKFLHNKVMKEKNMTEMNSKKSKLSSKELGKYP